MKSSFGISNFHEEISHLSPFIVFLYFFALITKEGFVISPCYSLEFCIQMGISFLFSFAFHFSSFYSYFKASSDNHFAFLHLFFLGMVLIPVSCTISQTSIHSSWGTLSISLLLIDHNSLKSRGVHQVTISELQFLPPSIAGLITAYLSLSASLLHPLESENSSLLLSLESENT